MEAAPSVKMRRGSPPIPPNYVSLRQLQELRLKEKEEQENRRREEEAAAVAKRKAEMEAMAAAAVAKREVERKAEMEAMAAAAVKREAARKPETMVSAVVSSLGPVRAKERRHGGVGPQWVAVAHHPAVPPPARRESVPIGVGRGDKDPGDAPRGGGKREGKAKGEGKEKFSVVTSAQKRTADEPGKPAEDSSHGRKPENKGEEKGKVRAKGKSAEAGSMGGSGESPGAPYRRRRSPKRDKGAGGRSAEPSANGATAKTVGASPPQGIKPENAEKPKFPGPKRADASPVVSDSSRGKKPDAAPVLPTSAAAGVVNELRVIAETNPEGLLEGKCRPPAVEVQGAAVQKPRVVSRRAWPRPHSDRCDRTGEQHGRVWVPKAVAGCTER